MNSNFTDYEAARPIAFHVLSESSCREGGEEDEGGRQKVDHRPNVSLFPSPTTSPQPPTTCRETSDSVYSILKLVSRGISSRENRESEGAVLHIRS